MRLSDMISFDECTCPEQQELVTQWESARYLVEALAEKIWQHKADHHMVYRQPRPEDDEGIQGLA